MLSATGAWHGRKFHDFLDAGAYDASSPRMTTSGDAEALDATITTEARCPSCATPLTQLAASATVIAGCEGCGGMWLDALACEAVARGELDEDKKRFARRIGAGAPERERTVFRDAAKPPPERCACPVCAADLAPVYLRDANLTVRACAAHGTFFARHELLRVADASAIRIAAGPARSPAAEPPPPPSRTARALFVLGAVMFAASMVMPSVEVNFFSTSFAPGFLCAIFGFLAFEKMPAAVLAACGNVWLVTCPIYAWRLRAQGTGIASAVAAVIGVVAASLWLVDAGKDFLAGYYVWVLSFFVIAAGFMARARHLRARE